MAFLPVLLDLLLFFLFSEGELAIPGCGSWMPIVLKSYLYLVFNVTVMSIICASPHFPVDVCSHTITSHLEITSTENSMEVREEGFIKFLKQ